MALTSEQIAALLSQTRQKGVYVKYLKDFIGSEEAGICVNDTWADLSGKKAATLKQGFEGAKDNKEAPEGAELVKVISNDDKVFLINLAHADVTLPETAVDEPVAA